MGTTYTFICHAYHDVDQLSLNLPELRRCYPEERIVVISDGDSDPRYAALAIRLGCELVAGERLYELGCGAAIISRLLSVFLEGPGDFLVKFDTDTRFFRQFVTIPPGHASGCIWGAFGFRYIQGGCRLLSRSGADKLAKSGLLTGPRYRDLESWCPPLAEDFYKRSGKVSEDFITRDAFLEAEIDIYDHPEVFSAGHVKRWRAMDPQTLRRVINADRKYSVTHPWKLADLKWAARVAPLLTAAVGDISQDVLSLEDTGYLSTDSSLAPG
jgi:hypothetical protein